MTSPRWHLRRTCTRCNSTLQGEAHRFLRSDYQPMVDGPDWECVGDWTEPGQAIAGTLCGPCAEAVERFTNLKHALLIDPGWRSR